MKPKATPLCYLFVLVISLFISGCSLSPEQASDSNLVELAPGTRIPLPQPAQLGYSLTASQLISANWQQDGEAQQQTLPVQLEVTPDKLVLAGFSSWGSRILSLTYQDNKIATAVMPGLGQALPKPEQVALNLMLTLWPDSAWQPLLDRIGWQLQSSGQQRQLVNAQGKPVIRIDYKAQPHLAGKIVFHDLRLGYRINITTLNYKTLDEADNAN